MSCLLEQKILKQRLTEAGTFCSTGSLGHGLSGIGHVLAKTQGLRGQKLRRAWTCSSRHSLGHNHCLTGAENHWTMNSLMQTLRGLANHHSRDSLEHGSLEQRLMEAEITGAEAHWILELLKQRLTGGKSSKRRSSQEQILIRTGYETEVHCGRDFMEAAIVAGTDCSRNSLK